MYRLHICFLFFTLGALLAVAVIPYVRSGENVYAEVFSHSPGSDNIVSAVVTEMNQDYIIVKPFFYNYTSDFPLIKFSISDDTTYGEVIRRVQDATIVESLHYDLARPTLSAGDTVYILLDRETPGPLTANYIKKVTFIDV